MKHLIFAITCCLIASFTFSQTSRESIDATITKLVKEKVDTELGVLKVVFGISVSGLTLLGIYLWFWKIKQTSEDVIKDKVDALVESKLAEKIGVKIELVRTYFQEIEKAQALKQKRILVVNKNTGKRIQLEKSIERAGFINVPVFKKWAEIEPGIDTNQFDLLLIDNEDCGITEEEIINLVRQYSQSLKFTCFTAVDVSPTTYQLLSGVVRFAKDINYVGHTIENALKS